MDATQWDIETIQKHFYAINKPWSWSKRCSIPMNLRGVSGRFLVEPPLSTSTVALKIIFRSGLVEGGSLVKFKKKISFKPFFRNSKLHRFWNILLPTTDGVFCVGMISSGSISSSSNWTGSRLLAEGIPDLFKSTFFGPLRGDVLLHLSWDPLLILSLFTEKICVWSFHFAFLSI